MLNLYYEEEINMKIISWNVNGLNAILQKDFIKTINQLEADFICIQETKISKDMHFNIGNYYQYFNYSQKWIFGCWNTNKRKA